ncbi:hybrid sensor histidine kinase/response regulator [Massilia violaceinigra]|uniref:hybrid sensor histidine kinase/response regulator n=1 Tax=Massilia violaceinigra TaxID=2045208 RepID=UPI00142D2A5A|nr:ATP-binding protein [Massilia violaceinigra]
MQAKIKIEAKMESPDGSRPKNLRELGLDGLPNLAAVDWVGSTREALRSALDSDLPTSVMVGPDLRMFYNDAYAEILGPRHPDAYGSPFWDVLPESLPAVGVGLAEALDGRAVLMEDKGVLMEFEGRSEVRFFMSSLSPLRNDDGTVAGVLSLALETTRRVANQRERDENASRLHRLVDQAPGFIAFMRGPDHVYELVNASIVTLMGERPYVGLPVREAVPELAGQGFYELLDQVYATGTPFVGLGIPAMLRRSPAAPPEQRYMNFIYQPIFEDGVVAGIFVEGSDVTEQHLAQVEADRLNAELAERVAELREADRRKDEFLAMLAHELRNPLAPISAAADILARSPRDLARIGTASAVIARQVKHIVRLVDELLDVSRVTRGLAAVNLKPTDLRAPIMDAVEQIRPLVERLGHALEIRLPDTEAMVSGDSARLTQIAANLLDNAARYTAPGGRLQVSLEGSETTFSLRVEDNGQGIEPHQRARIFDLFEQGPRPSARTQGGLGVGLSLVRSLVAMHGGAIRAEGVESGPGSAFIVTLPRHSESPGEAGSSRTEEGAGPLKVMVVDDNVDAAEMLGMLLGAAGHRVVVEIDPGAAIERAKNEPQDVYLLDLGLPGMDGVELSARLRQLDGGAKRAFIAVTGYGHAHDRKRTAEAGFGHHLVKPVDTEQLLAILADLARLRQS